MNLPRTLKSEQAIALAGADMKQTVIGGTESEIMGFSEAILTFIDTFYRQDLGARGTAEWLTYFQGRYSLSQFKDGLRKYGQEVDSNGRHLPIPTPADIIYRIESGQTASKVAWMMLAYAIERLGKYNAIYLHDIKLHYFIQRNGGWMVIAATPREQFEFFKRRFISEYAVIDVPDNFEHEVFPSFYGETNHYCEVKVESDGQLFFRLARKEKEIESVSPPVTGKKRTEKGG